MIKHIAEVLFANFLLPWGLGFLLVIGLMDIVDGIFNWWRARKIKLAIKKQKEDK